MVLPIYPRLIGRAYEVDKTPIWSTGVQVANSGIEYRVPRWSYPVWDIDVQYEVLRNRSDLNELNTLWGFYCDRQGAALEFRFEDPEDNSVSTAQIGVGDGVMTVFQLSRPLAGFREPFRDIKGTPVVSVNSLPQSEGWALTETGKVVFDVPPPSGAIITASFSFYYRVRFLEDRLSATRFVDRLWSTSTITLRSVK